MLERKMSCGHGPEGSGYVKTSDPVKAAEVERAYQDALESRTIYDNFWTQSQEDDDSITKIHVIKEDISYNPMTEFMEIINTGEYCDVTIDYPLEIFDVSGNDYETIKIREDPISIDIGDGGDVIELIY